MNKEIEKKFKEIIQKYSGHVSTVSFHYCGSGDSFGGFYFDSVGNDFQESDFEELGELIIEEVGADFNDDGGIGYVTINIDEKTLTVKDYYYIQEEQLNKELNIKI